MRILLAADGSEYGDQAAAQCAELVSGFSETATVEIKIITVSDFIVDYEGDQFIAEGEFADLVEQKIYKRASKILKCAEKIIRYENRGVEIKTEMFIGSAKKIIIKEAEDWKADLVVVGSHGYGFWKRNLLGSVSDAVVHHAPCSVLVVRKDLQFFSLT